MKKILCTVLVVVMCLTSVPFVGLVLKAGATEFSVGDIIEFGSYPQTEVKDEALIAELCRNIGEWEPYLYYSKNEQKNFIYYNDVVYKNQKYRAVYFNEYRARAVDTDNTDINSYQDDNGYSTNEIYWFKYEPIKWRILNPAEGLILSENIIDNQAFTNTWYWPGRDAYQDEKYKIYANNYAESSLRQWLNEDFYDLSFKKYEKDCIKTTTITNYDYCKSETYSSPNTDDKVFLLAYNQVNGINGFPYGSSHNSSYKRKSVVSNYAQCQGAYTIDGYGSWWLRNAADQYDSWIGSEQASHVQYDGGIRGLGAYLYTQFVHYTNGIRPAMCVDLDVIIDSNIYNMGEETYSFVNYVDDNSPGGHCFGMSVTSSGYHLGLLDPTYIGANNSREIYDISENDTVKVPICYFQNLQGSIRNRSMVAGGANYKDDDVFDVFSDWNEVTDYVRNHEYDNQGTLQIGYIKHGEGAHAINFLRYELVDGQERIYAYDNNCPHQEVYFYRDEAGSICHHSEVCPFGCFLFTGIIDCITLRYMPTYFEAISAVETIGNIINKSIYAMTGQVLIAGVPAFIMETNGMYGEYYMYEIPEDIHTVKITPLVDNATFTYMGQEYCFDKISADTYAEFTLSTADENEPVFEIINAPHEHIYNKAKTEPSCTEEGSIIYTCSCGDTYTETIEPTGHNFDGSKCKNCDFDKADYCSCNCHKGGIAGFFFKIILFFQKLFRTNQTCSCGVNHY